MSYWNSYQDSNGLYLGYESNQPPVYYDMPYYAQEASGYNVTPAFDQQNQAGASSSHSDAQEGPNQRNESGGAVRKNKQWRPKNHPQARNQKPRSDYNNRSSRNGQTHENYYYNQNETRNEPRNHQQYNRYGRNNQEDRRGGRRRDYEYENRNQGRYGNKGRYGGDNDVDSNRPDPPPKERNNWRRFDNNMRKKCNTNATRKKLDAASQRERLEQMITTRMLECLVCCDKVKHTDKIWTCQQCYHILHLNCVQAWAKSSKLSNGWRCPACQNVCAEVPTQYLCYCGKLEHPQPIPGVIPHACGEVCMRKSRLCDHKCTILCHPGPCPECQIMVVRSCGCGATSQTVKCCSDVEVVCSGVCGKLLECGMHKCQEKCHQGACPPCGEALRQECHCGKVGRKVKCTADFSGAQHYSCGETCAKLLACGNHKCEQICHEGPCAPCPRDPSLITTCPCGRTPLQVQRSSCLDPIPCCDKICSKVLNCGQPAQPHTCKHKCHEGPCPECPLSTLVRCRCGQLGKQIACKEVTTKADDARCKMKCTKKRLCGKHKCNQVCCIEVEHFCPLPCNHVLACGKHRCDRTCHSGRCPKCIETSFEELYCECGAEVIYPPIPCGTRPPTCNKPCSRARPCGHPANHSCHTGPCPPCTVLCKRWCHGEHEQRSAVPCFQQDFSCGRPCGKAMPCGTHKCDKPCHAGPCPMPCSQPCILKRAQCGHACGAPCHQPPCPETACRQPVQVSCPCGLQKATRTCIELEAVYREMEMARLRDKMSDLMKDQSVDLSDMVEKSVARPSTLKILECTEECRVLDRNRRLAIGLQIRNPDLSQKLTPRYSDFMRAWAKKDPQFCQKIHEKLAELVKLSKQSKQKSRSHSFESMNRDKRQFVHEYCEHFGCDSAAYDQEPNRNIVATAIKDKSWMPSMSLLEVIQRENGQRKVPVPILGKNNPGKSETVALKLPGRLSQKPSTPPGEEVIDYFDNPPM